MVPANRSNLYLGKAGVILIRGIQSLDLEEEWIDGEVGLHQ